MHFLPDKSICIIHLIMLFKTEMSFKNIVAGLEVRDDRAEMARRWWQRVSECVTQTHPVPSLSSGSLIIHCHSSLCEKSMPEDCSGDV